MDIKNDDGQSEDEDDKEDDDDDDDDQEDNEYEQCLDEDKFVEISPDKKFARFNEEIGRGAQKTVTFYQIYHNY